jgi:hypothetical protein
VKRGQANAERIEITEGLQGGETVITEGADRLKDGAKVTLPGDNVRRRKAGGGRQTGPAGRTPPRVASSKGLRNDGSRRVARTVPTRRYAPCRTWSRAPRRVGDRVPHPTAAAGRA